VCTGPNSSKKTNHIGYVVKEKLQLIPGSVQDRGAFPCGQKEFCSLEIALSDLILSGKTESISNKENYCCLAAHISKDLTAEIATLKTCKHHGEVLALCNWILLKGIIRTLV